MAWYNMEPDPKTLLSQISGLIVQVHKLLPPVGMGPAVLLPFYGTQGIGDMPVLRRYIFHYDSGVTPNFIAL